MSQPRLLFLCQTLPYPPDGGVRIRTYNVMRLLSRAFSITALCFYRRATTTTQERVESGVEALRQFADVEAFPIPQEHSRIRLLWDHARSFASHQVYTRFVHESSQFSRRLAEILSAADFDVVHLDSLDLGRYLDDLSGHSVICTHHNVESDLLRRRAVSERGWPRRLYLMHQAQLMQHEEQVSCGDVRLNVMVSAKDAERLQTLVPTARTAVVPNGVDTLAFTPASQPEEGVVFVGGHNWQPNRDAMEFFAEKVLPLVRRVIPQVAVKWVGRAPPAVRERYARHYGVQLTGYVDDVRPHVQGAACCIAPLLSGGGTRLKILDAWAMGKAVISTAVGCEGLSAEDGENILVRDDPEQFAEAVVALLRNPDLRSRIGTAARQTAVRTYDWEVIGRALVRQYLSVAATGRHETGVTG